MKAFNIKWDIDYDNDGYLPKEVEVPVDLTDEEEISDWLSDTYGYCHDGFELDLDYDRK